MTGWGKPKCSQANTHQTALFTTKPQLACLYDSMVTNICHILYGAESQISLKMYRVILLLESPDFQQYYHYLYTDSNQMYTHVRTYFSPCITASHHIRRWKLSPPGVHAQRDICPISLGPGYPKRPLPGKVTGLFSARFFPVGPTEGKGLQERASYHRWLQKNIRQEIAAITADML